MGEVGAGVCELEAAHTGEANPETAKLGMQLLGGSVGGLGPLHEKGDGDQPEEEEEAQAVLAGVIEDLCHGQVPLSGGHRWWGAGVGGSERGGAKVAAAGSDASGG